MESALRRAQIIWAALLFAAFMYVLLPEWIHPAVRPVKDVVVIVIGITAISMLGFVILFSRSLVMRSEDILRAQPNDTAAMARWQSGQVLTAVLSEAIVLYGLVLRFIGVDRVRALPFYIVGIGVMIMFRPKRIE